MNINKVSYFTNSNNIQAKSNNKNRNSWFNYTKTNMQNVNFKGNEGAKLMYATAASMGIGLVGGILMLQPIVVLAALVSAAGIISFTDYIFSNKK